MKKHIICNEMPMDIYSCIKYTKDTLKKIRDKKRLLNNSISKNTKKN